ncbi:G1 family glutamic endopeptidase [Amycolatopsis sp. DG1A-15b]|uniref:G1 family glutamic endopeptidase n=1 Tax=Amycolatopsis sp. DG1A-15b TaxID=3052846 RepID=UPI00255C1923|nr:G1 family glutamic endopeptidase [Amycolatopsis sp. DG1A-15b]WIX91494.1 G1 family endopeptidase [Amycolatopsis sp. DG1A-15b]
MKLRRLLPLTAFAAAVVFSAAAAAPASAAARPLAGYAGSPFAGTAQHTDVAGGHTPSVAGPLVNATSRNWAGYAITSLSTPAAIFTHVHASWTQRPITCPASDAWAVFWVGFDGWTNGTVEQGGSSARCVNGTPLYQLWWEMFPTNAIQPALTINAGDSVAADVAYDPATGKFTIKLDDATQHTSFSTTQTCAANLVCSRTSAEWIIEAPGRFGTGDFFPLANYGRALMGNTVGTDDAGHGGSMTASSTWQRTMIQEQDATTTYATTEHASRNGQNFAVTWAHQ